jgi:dTDP-4-dehydrorhamnose 3,5-epimerase
MKKLETTLSGVLLLEPRVFGDDRGFFLESYNQRAFAEIGITESFVQDNHSFSERNVIRGLHYQILQPQGKLVRAITGEILDVALDLRRDSPTFGKWESFTLSGENKRMLWIPRGFAHGFRVVSQTVHVVYKATDFYAPEHERTVVWNDPALKIDWQIGGEQGDPAIVSGKDQRGVSFDLAEKFDSSAN